MKSICQLNAMTIIPPAENQIRRSLRPLATDFHRRMASEAALSPPATTLTEVLAAMVGRCQTSVAHPALLWRWIVVIQTHRQTALSQHRLKTLLGLAIALQPPVITKKYPTCQCQVRWKPFIVVDRFNHIRQHYLYRNRPYSFHLHQLQNWMTLNMPILKVLLMLINLCHSTQGSPHQHPL
jgi:hypothetical protein